MRYSYPIICNTNRDLLGNAGIYGYIYLRLFFCHYSIYTHSTYICSYCLYCLYCLYGPYGLCGHGLAPQRPIQLPIQVRFYLRLCCYVLLCMEHHWTSRHSYPESNIYIYTYIYIYTFHAANFTKRLPGMSCSAVWNYQRSISEVTSWTRWSDRIDVSGTHRIGTSWKDGSSVENDGSFFKTLWAVTLGN